MQYSAEVIDDVSDELHGRLVMSEIPSQDTDYRYLPCELPEAAAGPEVDGTVPLGDSDAVLAAQPSTSAVSTASEPPCDTVSSMEGPMQPQEVESTSSNAGSASEVTIPSSKSAVYHSKKI